MAPVFAGLLLALGAIVEGQGPPSPSPPTLTLRDDALIALLRRRGDAAKREEVPRPPACRAFEAYAPEPPSERTPYPPIGNPWPVHVMKAQIVKDPVVAARLSSYFPPLSPEEVRTRLALYLVVSRDEWLNGYSHVGSSDEGGWLATKTQCFQWVVRPGGLAFVVYPDRTAVYLAGCHSDLWPPR